MKTSIYSGMVVLLCAQSAVQAQTAPSTDIDWDHDNQLSTHPSLAAPRLLQAVDGKVESPDGYASPSVADVNGDGRLDLMVGDFGTYHDRFGTEEEIDRSANYMGSGGRVQILLGEGEGKAFRFGRSNWASTRDGKIHSPTW